MALSATHAKKFVCKVAAYLYCFLLDIAFFANMKPLNFME